MTNPNLVFDYPDSTALEYLCGRRKVDEERSIFLLKMLLKLGANHSHGKHRPLILATKRGRIGLIEALLEKGADINQVGTIDGNLQITALSVAADNNCYELITFFLDKKASIYVKGCPCSPLRFVLQNEDSVSLNLFLDKMGIQDFNQLCDELNGLKNHGKTVQNYINYLLKLPNRRDGYLFTVAIVKNNFTLLDTLIQLNGNIPDKLYELFLSTGKNGLRSFLHMAAECKGGASTISYFINKYHPDLFLYTEDNDSDLNVEMTAFTIATKHNNLESMKAMLNGCTPEDKVKLINTCDKGPLQKSPLHYAALNGNYEITEFLLENGADPYKEKTDGYVPLFEAMYKGHDHLLVLFKKYGVSLESPLKFTLYGDEKHLTRPIFIAIKLHQTKVLDKLCELGVNVDMCEGDPCAPVVYVIVQDNGKLDIANVLIGKYNANVDCLVSDDKGAIRPIHVSICKDKPHLFECFLQYANPSFKEGEVVSPFGIAALLGQFSFARKIMHRGAIPTFDDFKLLLQFKNKEQEHLEMIQLILNHPKFSLPEYCLHNPNPLKIAMLEDNAELLQILLTKYVFDILRNGKDKNLLFYALILNRTNTLKVFFKHLRKDKANDVVIEAMIRMAYASSLLEEEDYTIIQQLYKESEVVSTKRATPLSNALPPVATATTDSNSTSTPTPNSTATDSSSNDESIQTSPQYGFFSHEQKKSLSSHSYLKLEQKLSDDEIKQYKEEIRFKRKKRTEPVNSTKEDNTPKEFTWFEDAIHSSFIQVIEKNSKTSNYLWLAEEVLEAQGCENLDAFHKDRYTFSDQCVKPLAGAKYNRQFEINHERCIISATHELKIKNSADRILLFPVKSDDTEAVLYIGAVYKKDGFHLQKDKKLLQNEQAEKMSVILITLPKNLKLQQEVSNNTNSY